MASLMFSVRTTKTDPDASVKVKIRFNAYMGKEKVSAYALSGVVVPKKVWDCKGNYFGSPAKVGGMNLKYYLRIVKNTIICRTKRY